jgi:hypothetical protein
MNREGPSDKDLGCHVEASLGDYVPAETPSPSIGTFSLGTVRKPRHPAGSPTRKFRKDRRLLSTGHSTRIGTPPTIEPTTNSPSHIITTTSPGSVSGASTDSTASKTSERLNRIGIAIKNPLSYLRNKKRRTKATTLSDIPQSPNASYLPSSYDIGTDTGESNTGIKRGHDKIEESRDIPTPPNTPMQVGQDGPTLVSTSSSAVPSNPSKINSALSAPPSKANAVVSKQNSAPHPSSLRAWSAKTKSTQNNKDGSALSSLTVTSGEEKRTNKLPRSSDVNSILDEKRKKKQLQPTFPTSHVDVRTKASHGDSKIQAARVYTTEQTPLLVAESNGTTPNSLGPTLGGKWQSIFRKEKRWSAVKKHMEDGDFLVYGSSQGDDPGQDSTLDDTMHEIRSGIATWQCIVAIVVYLTIGTFCYSFIFEPSWSIVDSCFFAVTTFTTVGYGSSAPSSEASMIFTSIFALVGVAFLGVALGVLGAHMIETEEEAVQMAETFTKYEVLSIFESSFGHEDDHPTGEDDVEERHEESKRQNLRTLCRIAVPMVLICCLAACIGFESGWDFTETAYYLVITGACSVPSLS